MSGFYFSFEFKSKRGITYFLPLKLKTSDKELAERYYTAMKAAISDKFEIIYTELPMDIIFNIESAYVKEMLSRPFSGKLVQLKASEWEFVDFDPELDLSFNENLSNAMNERIEEIDWLGIEYNNNTLAKVINNYKFPVQIISNPNFEPTDFLVSWSQLLSDSSSK